jgi:O-antigen/teichoic acid export membrane protein
LGTLLLKAAFVSILERLRGGGGSYALSLVQCHLLNGISGLLAARWLDPLMLGWWGTSQLLRMALDPLRLGIVSGINREYPFLIGANKPEEAHRVLETGLFHTIVTLVISQIFIGVAVIRFKDSSPYLVLGVLVSGAVWSFEYYTLFVRSMMRTPEYFKLMGRVQLGITALDAAAVVLVYRFGYYGLVGRALLTALVTAIIFYLYQPIRVKARWHWASFKDIFKFGRHPYITGYLLLVGQQAERVMLLRFPEGINLVGLYTPAVICISFLQVVPNAIQSYFYPQIVESYGRERDPGKLASVLFSKIKSTAIFMLFLSIAAAIGIAALVFAFLPKYLPGLNAALIVCAAGPFYTLRFCTIYYASLHLWTTYYLYTALQTILPFAAIWLLMHWLPPLQAVAAGFVAGVVVSGSFLLISTVLNSKRKAEAVVP